MIAAVYPISYTDGQPKTREETEMAYCTLKAIDFDAFDRNGILQPASNQAALDARWLAVQLAGGSGINTMRMSDTDKAAIVLACSEASEHSGFRIEPSAEIGKELQR
jgi:hypothetical protein